MSKENSLDADFGHSLNRLTEFQLIGIITEPVKYPKSILDRVSQELDARGVSAEEVQLQRQRYLSVELTTETTSLFSNYKVAIAVFILLSILLSNSLIWEIPVSWSIFIASLLAINWKFRFGSKYQTAIWQYLSWIYLALFFILFILALNL